MLDERNVYAQDNAKNNFLTMTKEQILTAILQAVNEGTIGDIDAGFITKLKEMNDGAVIQIWIGTMAEYTALPETRPNTLYMFTDDPTLSDIEANFTDIKKDIKDIQTEIKKTKILEFPSKYKFVDALNDLYTVITEMWEQYEFVLVHFTGAYGIVGFSVQSDSNNKTYNFSNQCAIVRKSSNGNMYIRMPAFVSSEAVYTEIIYKPYFDSYGYIGSYDIKENDYFNTPGMQILVKGLF